MTDQTTTDEPFHFTDVDGDYLHIGIPSSPTGGSPAVSFHTMAEPVHVPVEELEGLIAAVRSMAAVQAPAAPLPVSEARTRLLQALDASYCQALGHTPEGLLAAYEASRTQTVDPAALREIAVQAIRDAACTGDCGETEEDCRKERIQPFAWHHGRLAVAEGSPEQFADAVLAAVLPATTNHDTDTAKLAATLREVLDTFSPMHDVYGGPVTYYDGSADITPTQYEGWRAVLDGSLRRVADETAATETQAHAPLNEWRVEILDADEWMPASRLHRDRDQAADQFRMASERRPLWNDGTKVQRRLVRETTTYTVEQPAAGARQDGAPS